MNPRVSLTILLTLFVALLPIRANAQTEFPPAYNNQAHYAVGDLVTDYGNIYRCEVAVTKPYIDPSKFYQNWELFYVRNNTTLVVGVQQTFPNLAVAWNYVRNCRVAPAVYLHLSISTANGLLNESINTQLNLNSDSGSQISIIGDSEANITLTFPYSSGFYLDTNHAFGSISHLTLVGTLSGGVGIYAGTGASYADIDNVGIGSFGQNILAEHSATIVFGENISISGGAVQGCTADTGASVEFYGGALTATGDSMTGKEELYAAHGGRISAEYSNIQDVYTAAYASNGGYVDVSHSTFTNYHYGCFADFDGNITAEDCTLNGASGLDLLANHMAIIDAIGDSTMNTSVGDGAMIFTS